MSNDYDYVEDFVIVDSPDDVDTVTLGFIVRDEATGLPKAVRITLTGDVTYPGEDSASLTIPQSEDFLQQLAAILGYEVHKPVDSLPHLW